MNSFSIRCTEGFNGGLPLTFKAIVKEDEQEIQNMTTTVPWFTFSSLKAGTAYKIFIYSTNAKGSSEPFLVDVVTQGKRVPDVDLNLEIPAGEFTSYRFVNTLISYGTCFRLL